jgi:putative exporter of polyketide antibiotics
MPFALAIIGIALLVAGVRNTQDKLFSLIKGDFSGQNNFIFWMVSIFAIGAVGYIPKFKPVSMAFLTLVIVVLFLKRGTGFFAQATSALNSTTNTVPTMNLNQTVFNNLQPLGGIQ